MKITFNGEIVPGPGGFSVKVSFDGVPTQAQAQEIGKWLNDAASDYFASKGAKMTLSSGDSPAPLIVQQ